MAEERYSDRADALNEALHLITGDRNADYGPPTQDFDRAAGILQAMGYRGPGGRDIVGHDIALMVMAVKMSRLVWTPGKRDSWVDIAGYAGCGYECAAAEIKAEQEANPLITVWVPDATGLGFAGTATIEQESPQDDTYSVDTTIRRVGASETLLNAYVVTEPDANGIGYARLAGSIGGRFRFDVADWVPVK